MSPSRGNRRTAGAGGDPSKRVPKGKASEPELLGEGNKPLLPAAYFGERIAVPPGFQLRRLLLLGTNVQPAELRFTPGLNVITGPSNTGKSFAFVCLDFMLG